MFDFCAVSLRVGFLNFLLSGLMVDPVGFVLSYSGISVLGLLMFCFVCDKKRGDGGLKYTGRMTKGWGTGGHTAATNQT